MKKVLKKKNSFPTIQPLFAPGVHSGALSRHINKGREILEQLLPKDVFNSSLEESDRWLSKNLPLVTWDEPSSIPNSFSIYFLCSPTHELRAEKVLPELIRKWLIPEKEVYILAFHNLYFHMRDISSNLFFIAEVKILIEDGRDWGIIQSHLPLLANEVSLSLSSTHYLENVLDTKALSLDQKSSRIQEYLRHLTKRVPEQFDTELFREMSTFFALSKPEFRKFRQPKHLTRLVVSHYLMRRNLLHNLSVSPEKRHLDFRFIRSNLHFPFGTKRVLGLSIAVGLTDRYETFEDIHIIRAVQKFIPSAQVVKGSYYFYRGNHDRVKNIYLELEKKDGSSFFQDEIAFLKKELREELKKRIEKLIPSVFMIRNEEEVMRNILLLSQELKYLSDLPQVMINFDKQTQDDLHFTVLVVRVLKKHDLPIEEAFQKVDQPFKYLSDRVQNVGYVRKKNPKEANVFHLVIPKGAVLRTDSSVNFYMARQQVITLIKEALGEIRDYNGGMILKQGELFAQLKEAFSGIVDKNQELLENFFFALTPIEAQATSSLKSLKQLFQLFLNASETELTKRESYFQKVKKKKNTLFAILSTKDRSIAPILSEKLNYLENFSKSLVRAEVNFQGNFLQGFIYETSSLAQLKQFQKCLDQGIKTWITQIRNSQELRLSFLDLPPSLDPRLGGDEMTSALNKMLFEGLTRLAKESKPALAIAKSVDISPDQKRYVFKLRPTRWSDGGKVVAKDFEYAWKKILSPSFYTPFAYFFYPIKNARKAKEGQVDLNEVGVRALDEATLVVDLENPSPEFLELTSHSLYSPVKHKIDTLHPNWAQSREEAFVCNGPFIPKQTLPNGGYELVKNPNYWDISNVKLDRILVGKHNADTALQLFKNDEIDWLGHPMAPWDPRFEKEKGIKIETSPTGLQWCVFNTQRFPFDHLKMRQAFFFATSQAEILKDFQDDLGPPVSPLPKIHSQINDKSLANGDKKLAKTLFEEALKEVGLTRKNFPILTMCFTGGPSRQKVIEALICQWEKTLNISCRIEEYDFHTLFSKLTKGEYQIGSLTWKAWINDPIYTLSVFEYRNNRVNFSKWEDARYQKLLRKAKQEIIQEKRLSLYEKAEKLLIQECPTFAIHNASYKYSHRKGLKGVLSSELGNIDFRESCIVPKTH